MTTTIEPPWTWPLPRLDQSPTILSVRDHAAILGYERGLAGQSIVTVLAAADGEIAFAERTSRGFLVSVDHVDGWSTHYSELAYMLASPTDRFRGRRKARVRAGDPLGFTGSGCARIVFEIWRRTSGGHAPMDPSGVLRTAALLAGAEGTSRARVPRILQAA